MLIVGDEWDTSTSLVCDFRSSRTTEMLTMPFHVDTKEQKRTNGEAGMTANEPKVKHSSETPEAGYETG